MLDKQENKYSMYRVVEHVLEENNIIWNGTPAFVTTKGAFSNKLTAISTASQQQQAIITGIATDKKVLKVSLVNITAPVAAAVIAYASQTNNNELLDAVNYTQTQLLKTRDDMIGDRCQIIHDKANANLVALAPYGITAPVLTTVQTAITDYNAKAPAPSTAKQSKKTATINMRNLFKETDVILKLQLDKLMVEFKTTNLNFYNTYKAARVVIDLGATHTKLRITVKDASGALNEATVSLLQNNFVITSGLTGADGKALLTKVKPGTYDLKVEKSGYTAQSEAAIKFKAGKEVLRTVTLATGSSNPANGTALREGDVPMGMVANINIEDIKATPLTKVSIDVTGASFRVYASPTNNGLPGAAFVDVQPGVSFQKPASEFAFAVGLSDTNKFLMVQNIGATNGHYKFFLDHLEE